MRYRDVRDFLLPGVLTIVAAGWLLVIAAPDLEPFWPGQATERAAESTMSADKINVDVRLPLAAKSTRFAVIGDNGTAGQQEYQVGALMEHYREAVHFDFVLMLGDNLYGGKSPTDYRNKFEVPYQPLLDNGVKFYASLGNHDEVNETKYKPFNMNGHRYYDFERGDATFFALDSTYMDSNQLAWLSQELAKAKTPWKICYFHHPLYSDAMHGPDLDLRHKLVPVFEKYGVKLVLSGHDHVYERFLPQNGIYYFVLGNSGQLRYHDLKHSAQAAKQFDTDRCFGMFEVTAKAVDFEVVSRTGAVVDSGEISAEPAQAAATAGAK